MRCYNEKCFAYDYTEENACSATNDLSLCPRYIPRSQWQLRDENKLPLDDLRKQFNTYTLRMSDSLSDDFLMSPNFKDWLSMWVDENWKTWVACARFTNSLKD